MNNPNNTAGAANGNDDYLDKAFAAGAKKFGGAQGQKVANNRAMSEKIVRDVARNMHFDMLLTTIQTDGLRGVYEKVTGKKVNPKYSN